MGRVHQAITLVLCSALVAQAQGNSFNRVRYNGGTLSSKVSPHDWDNKLTITADLITLQLKDGAKVEIPPKTVTSLSYGQEAHRRVGTMIALAILVALLIELGSGLALYAVTAGQGLSGQSAVGQSATALSGSNPENPHTAPLPGEKHLPKL